MILNGYGAGYVSTVPRINSIISPVKPLPTIQTANNPVATTSTLVVTPTNSAVAAYLQKFGIAYNPTDPFAQNYITISNNNVPPSAPSNIRTTIECCLRARGILYYKSTPGDCALPSKPSGIGGVKLGMQIGESSLGTVSALGTAGIIGLGGAATALSVATLGVGLAAVPILAIVQHHQAAVATEQATICQVAEMVNQAIPTIDYQVQQGQASPNDGITLMQYVCQNAIQGLDSIRKTCNAACVYEACLRAHMDFSKVFYPVISPVTGNHPVAPGTPSIQSPASFPKGTTTAPTLTVKPPFNTVATAIVPQSPVANPTIGATGNTMPINVAPAAGTAAMPTTIPPGTVTFPVWELVVVVIAIIAAFWVLK